MRYTVAEPKGNEVNGAFLLPVYQTIGCKTDILVRIEELEVIRRGAFWLLRVKQRDGALERRRSLLASSNATAKQFTSSAIETAVPGEF